MSEVFIPNRSVKNYIYEFGENGVKKGLNKDLIRSQLLDTFQKEIFNQLMVRVGDPTILARDISTVDEETKRKVDNILSNSVRKWKRLCIEFSKYSKETYDLIMPGDLMVTLEDIVKEQCGENDAHLLSKGEDIDE